MSSTTAPGADAEYLDVAAGLKPTTGPLKNTKAIVGNVKAGKKASKELDRDVAVWDIYDCTDKPTFNCGSGETALSATDDRVAFDRNTGEAVDWKGARSDVDGEVIQPGKFKGLYFKFPFDAQKKTYQFWDGTLRKATPAKYVGEGKVKGMKAYEYEQTIEPIKTGTIDVPGSLVGSDEATVTADRIYSSVSTYQVDPVTGVVLVGQTAQDSYLELDGERVLTTTKATLKLHRRERHRHRQRVQDQGVAADGRQDVRAARRRRPRPRADRDRPVHAPRQRSAGARQHTRMSSSRTDLTPPRAWRRDLRGSRGVASFGCVRCSRVSFL